MIQRQFGIGNSKQLFPIPNPILSGRYRSVGIAVLADERAVARSGKKSRVDQRAEDRIAGRFIETPQPARLLRCEPKPGHFQKFTSYTSNDFLNSAARILHQSPVGRCVRTALIHTECQRNH